MKINVPVLPRAAVAAALALTLPLAAQEAPPEKVRKHYEMLLKRPAPGYLFDRFFNGWLDTATLDDLEKFLTARVSAGGATADHLLLAYFHARQGDSVKAIAQFRTALEKDPGSADAWYQKAVVEARTLNFDTALTDLEKAAAAKPKADMELNIRQLQARLLIRSGKSAAAGDVFKKLLASRPGDEELREDIIELVLAEGLMDEAAAAARELIELTKDAQKKVLRRLRLGDILQRAGKREEAVDIYAATLADTGVDSWLEKEILSQIEQVFRREDDIAGLRERLQRMVTAEPRRLALRLAQTRLLTADGNAEAAIKAWQEILALTPGNRPLRETYIEQMAALKKLPEAITQMEELVARHPADLELIPRLANLHFLNKDNAKCLATLQQFIEKSDKQEGVWLRIAALMERYSMGNDALALLEKGTAALPESEAIAEAHAATLHTMEKKEEAIAIWKKLAAGKPRERTLQVARMAAGRNETQAAFDILHSRLDAFGEDPLYLAELTAAAVRVKREADALPWARKRIALTKEATDLESALDDAVRIILTLNKEQDVIREITETSTPQELSLAAALQESLGNPKAAEELLKKVSTSAPDLGGSLQVRLFITRGEPLKAAETLRKVIELPGSRTTSAVQRLVDLYQRAGKLEEALLWVAEWKRLSPGAMVPWETEAHLLGLSGRNADALKTLRQAAQLFPDNEDLKASLARRYRDEGRLADAQRILEQLYEDGKDPGAKLKWVSEMAQTAEQQGRTKELVESFEERRRTNRGSTLPLLALSEIYRTAGSYEERRAALLEAARVKPDDVELLMEIARIEQSQGELASATDTLRKARQLDSSNRATQKLAEVLFATGKDDEAVKMMEEIDTAKRIDPAAVESLVMSVTGTGEWERAEAFLRPLLTKYPGNYRLLYLHGLMLEETAQNDAAKDLFLKLLEIDKELPGARPAKNREYLESLRRQVPDSAVQITDFISSSNSAYVHRQRRGGSSYYTTSSGITTLVSSGGSAQPLYLPSELSELRTLALQHLAGLAQSMEESALAALKKDLQTRGVAWAEHIMDLNRRGGGSIINAQTAALLKAAPKEDYSLALLCLNLTYSAAGRYAPEVREAYARFHDRYPQLAAMAMLSLLRHDDPADLPLLKEGEALLATIERPIDQLSYSLSNVTWMASGDNTAIKPERKEIAKVIMEKLEALYAALPDTSQARRNLQQSIFQACINRRDWPRMVTLLEEELAEARASSLSNAYRAYYYSSNNQFILEPPFPPRQLPQIPAQISNRWGLDDNGGGFSLYIRNEDTEIFKNAVRSGKEPIVRILLALKFGEEAFIDEMLKGAASLPEPDAGVCTIMAGWHSGKSEPDKALEWLRRTQFLPLTRDDRATVDRYLLGVITLGGLNPAPDSPDFNAARDAVVRLRQTRLDNPKREAIASALTALGLSDDADKLLALNASTSRSPSGSSAVRTAAAQQAMDVKIEQLFKQGQKEKGMTLLLRELRSAGRAVTGGTSYRDSDAMIRLTNRLNLKGEVLEQLKPAEGATAGLAEYGWLCTALEEKDAGKLWNEKAVAARPRDLTTRFRTAAIYLQGEKPDAEAAWKLISAAPDDVIAGMDMQTAQRMFLYGGTFQNLTANLDLLRRFLEKYRDVPNMDWNWVPNALDACTQQTSFEGVNLPSIYAMAPEEQTSLTRAAKLKEYREQRRALHDEICRHMGRIPALRLQAFQRLQCLQAADKKEDDGLTAMAKEAVLTKADASTVYSYSGYYYGDSSQMLPRVNAEEFLAGEALKKSDAKLLDGIADELDKQDRKDEAKLLRARNDLYFCPETEFAAKARLQIVPEKPEDRYLGDAAVIAIWQKRKLPPSLGPAILERLQKAENRRTGATQLPMEYVSALTATGKRAEAEAFLADACTAILGPPEKRGELLRQHWNPRSYSPPGTPGYQIRTLRQSLTQAMRREDVAVLAIMALNDHLCRYFDEVKRDDYYGDQLRMEYTALRDWPSVKKPDRIRKILEASPFLSDAPDWHPVLTPGEKDSTVLAWMLKAAVRSGNNPATRRENVTLLETWPATLGRDILIAAAEAEKEESMRHKVLDLLAARRSALEGMAPEPLAEVAVFARELNGDDPAKFKPSAEAAALLEWLLPKAGGPTDELAVFLKPAEKWDRPIPSGNWQQSVRKALRLAAKQGPEKFAAVVTRAKALRQQGQPSPVSSQPKHENSPLALALLSHLQETEGERKKADDPAFWNSLIYAADAALDPANELEWDESGSDVMGERAFTVVWKDCLKGRSKEEALAELIARLEKALTAPRFRLYSQGFINTLTTAGKDGLTPEQMKAWIASPAASAGPVAKECALLMTVSAARQTKDRRAPDAAAVTAYTQQVLAAAGDESIGQKVRLTMTAVWLGHAAEYLPAEVVTRAAGMLADAWKARRSYDTREAEIIFRAILALPDAAVRKTLLQPLLEAVPRIVAVRMNTSLDEMMVTAAVECGDTALLQRVAGNRATRIHHGFLAAMLKGGGDDEAKRWFEQNALSIYTKAAVDYAGWSEDIAKKGGAFALSLDTPHKTYLAELLIAALPGSADSKERDAQKRERMKPLAKKFGSVPLPDAPWRDRILDLLGEDNEVINEAAEAFGPIAEKEPLGVLARTPGQVSQAKLRVLHLWVVSEFKKGRFGPFEQYLAELAARRTSNVYYSSNSTDPWVKSIRDTLQWTTHAAFMHSHEWTEEERTKLGAIYRDALQPKTYISEANESEEVVQSALLFHALTGQNEALATWWNALPEDQRKKTRERFWYNNIDTWLTKEDVDRRFGSDRPARLKFVRDYLANPIGVAGGEASMDRPAAMEWVTRKEILEAGDEIMQRQPDRRTDTGRQLAVVAEKERAWDQGAAILAATVAGLEKEKEEDKKARPRLLLQRALMLLQGGKSADALQETEALQDSVLAPFKDGKVESEALSALATWIDVHGRSLLAAGRNDDALAFLGINPSVQKLAVREAGGNLSDAAVHESVFRYAEIKTGIKIFNLVPKESEWRYRDAADAPPSNWNAPDFDDKDWASGKGRLGYGDPVTTTLTYGPDKNNKPMAAYFRTEFNVADAKEIQSMHLGVQRDDGCIIYLNGQEILRQNMPEGTVTHDTAALVATDQSLETEYVPSMLKAEHLVSGRNVLAVEIHQSSATSTDLTFDLQLRGNLPDPKEVMSTLDPAELGPKLGPVWTALPDAVKKALE